MAEPIGVALIGAGMWGRRLLEPLQRTTALRVVTCYSRTQEKREAFARQAGCAAADSFEAALDHPNVQGALLLTPNNVHREQAVACAERGKHVFVEKPIADAYEDGVEMQTACTEAGVTLFVGHCFRRLGGARKARQLIDEDALGEVVLVQANFSLPSNLTPDRWRYYRATCPGGPLLQLGIHHADTLQYLLGPVRSVRGSFAHLVTEAEIDDVGAALLEFASSARGALTSSYVSPKTFHIQLFGSRANLDYYTDMSVWPNAAGMDGATNLTLQTRSGREQVSFNERDMLVEELDEFARCVRGEAQPETGATEGLRALQVILGAIESHASGKPVALREI